MAQTKRKRRTKHRGNAAGVVEVRGRTGRRSDSAPKTKEQQRASARERRAARYDKPPTWQGAFMRAGVATALFFVVVVALFKQPLTSAGALAGFMLLVYIPLGYYTDMFFYRRRQRQKLQQRAAAGGKSSGTKPSQNGKSSN